MADQPSFADHLDANRANWDERVAIHLASSFYDVEEWLADRRGPRPREVEALGDVSGLDLVHLQCHFGLDTLAFAHAGARVTGLDFSGAAIAQARDLATRAGPSDRARFVEGDVLKAADVLAPETYDIVYVSLAVRLRRRRRHRGVSRPRQHDRRHRPGHGAPPHPSRPRQGGDGARKKRVAPPIAHHLVPC